MRLLAEMRREAVHTPGYVSGETLRDSNDPTHYVVVSTWTSKARWSEWETSEARLQRDSEIVPLLIEPETITVLEHI